MRRRASEAAFVFNKTFGGFDDAEGDSADHRHNKLPDVFQLGLPNASFNGSCSSTPAGYGLFLQTLLRSFLGTLEQLFSNSCISAFRRGDDSDRLSMTGTFSETHRPAWFGRSWGGS